MTPFRHLLSFVVASLFLTAGAFAQDAPPNHRITAHWGSLRTPYSAVSSGLSYELGRLSAQFPLGLEARIDSFGTFFTLGSPSFDALAVAYGRWEGPVKGSLWSIGGGALLEARLQYDERSAAKTGGAPVIRFCLEGEFPVGWLGLTWGGKLPFEVDFYNNGAAFVCDPELRLGYGFAFLALREKNRLLVGGKNFSNEFRWDTDLGVGAAF